METTLQRIKKFIDYKGINNSRFEKIVGFSNGAFASQLRKNKTIGVDKVENILKKFPELEPEWLLTGNGEMIKGNLTEQEKIRENYRAIVYNTQQVSEPLEAMLFEENKIIKNIELIVENLKYIKERLDRIESHMMEKANNK